MRKEAGFDIADRIITTYQAPEELASVFQAWSEYIQAETLTTRLLDAPPQDGAYVEEHQVDGETLTLGVKRRD